MHDEHTTAPSTEAAEKLGYEDSDVSIPVLMRWGFFLAVFVGATYGIVLLVYFLLPRFTQPAANVGMDIARKVPAADMPQLQSDPVKDIKDYRRAEAKRTGGYGTWKDGDGKDVQYIPIDRAMQIVETKGLPIEGADAAKNDVTPPVVDRGFVDNPLPAEDNGKTAVPGKTGAANDASLDDRSFQKKSPGM